MAREGKGRAGSLFEQESFSCAATVLRSPSGSTQYVPGGAALARIAGGPARAAALAAAAFAFALPGLATGLAFVGGLHAPRAT